MRATRLLPWIGGTLAGLAVLFATAPRGPGLTPDGMSYLGAAESLVRTGALREPFAMWNAADSTTRLADYPAGYSLVLAVPIALGAPAAQAARWINALSVGVAVGIGVSGIGAVAGPPGALIGLVLLILMPALTDVSLLALSEPLFLLLLAATIAGMVRRPDRPWVAGAGAAAANLVRYAGVFLVAGVGVWSALQPGPGRTRLRRVAIAVLPGVLLHLYWRVLGIAPGGGISAGAFGGLAPALGEGWNTGMAWLAPGVVGGGVAATIAGSAVLVLLIAALAAATRPQRGNEASRRLLAATGLLAVMYLGTVGFARLYVIADVPFDSRILLPLFFILSIGIATALGSLNDRRSKVVSWALLSVWAALAITRGAREIGRARAGGSGYESAEWQDSPVAAWLSGPGRGRTLYTTDPAAIWFIAHRPSRLLPDTLAADSVRAFAARFGAAPSALVAFDVTFELASASPDELAAALHLTPVARFAHGVVWGR